MSEDDSRGEEVKEEEEGETDSGAKTEEEAASGEGEEDAKEKKDAPKKRGRKPGPASPAKRPKKEKGEGGGTKRRKRAVKKHPKTIEMVVEAIDNLAEKRGSSVQAIKAYIHQNFKAVPTKSMLRRTLNSGLQQSIVARPKGQSETQIMSGRYLLGKSARMEDEDEVMPQKSKRAQEAMRSKMKKKKKGGKKGKKSPKKPVVRKVTPTKAKPPVRKNKRGRK